MRTEVHPAFHRFQQIHGSGPRLLFITAAPGTGRRLFARSWLDGAPGEIHDLSDGSPETSSGIFDQLQQLTERLDATPSYVWRCSCRWGAPPGCWPPATTAAWPGTGTCCSARPSWPRHWIARRI
ncbi:hypothetical protein, partial [Arthrobacter sp. JCM 19049]|uniref:hypothetical protein n=1 Tax=Arthrobacter sp. JCM 19049 TaxID=1460643 RepID=UPI0024368B00